MPAKRGIFYRFLAPSPENGKSVQNRAQVVKVGVFGRNAGRPVQRTNGMSCMGRVCYSRQLLGCAALLQCSHVRGPLPERDNAISPTLRPLTFSVARCSRRGVAALRGIFFRFLAPLPGNATTSENPFQS